MARAAFSVVYDGPALADGEMPVRDLAPALLALGELFTEASTVLYPDLDPPALNIQATKEGSFDVSLVLEAGDIWDQIVKLFTSPEANALINLRDVLFGVGTGVFFFTKWLRRRPIAKEEPLDAGRVRITLGDGTVAEFPAEVLALYKRASVRKKTRQVVSPVERPGVEHFEVVVESQVALDLGPDDVPAFDPEPGEATTLLDAEQEAVLAIVSPVFKEGNKWRFNDGSNEFLAAIEDPAFIERVNAGEPFASGDMLRVRIRVVQTEQEGKLHTERSIEQALEHMRRPQGQIPIEPGSTDEG